MLAAATQPPATSQQNPLPALSTLTLDTFTSEDEPPGSHEDHSQALEPEGSKPYPTTIPDQVEAHILCAECTQLIAKSRIIQEFMGTAEPEDAYTIWKRLRGGERTELISHSHALPSIPAFEAGTTCHLCSLVWHMLPCDAVEHGCGFIDVEVAEDRSQNYVPVIFVVAPSSPPDTGSVTGDPTHEPRMVGILLKRYRGK
ncbi:hypothetical protein B0T09DRAFT_402866 [Sordaria sp. MPI-SDFR-AT-0083]|nr:hypothetical protein B0T09DRAFT_402866 [Sordaria sp. MPI-SDFR-AT-0083]